MSTSLDARFRRLEAANRFQLIMLLKNRGSLSFYDNDGETTLRIPEKRWLQ